ncbi:MAG: AraC family transcriptional regulator [Clostridia bacterium]|nr:AraC family transcriptional regulator [Clostridia bacterium]
MSQVKFYRFSDNRSHALSDADFYYHKVGTTRDSILVRPHTHDYYELEFLSSGKCRYIINGTEMILNAGALIFIRDTDTHEIHPIDDGFYTLHNIAFSREIVSRLTYFLGDSYNFGDLFTSNLPRILNLSPIDREYFERKFQMFSTNVQMGKDFCNRAGKELLFKIMTSYFHISQTNTPAYKRTPPNWFLELCSQMLLDENWRAGTGRMCELSGKSASHIAHATKRYLGISPTEFINDLKLSYAKKMLIHSDFPIVDICISSGFENESWFYKKFKEKYGITPDKYRKEQK